VFLETCDWPVGKDFPRRRWVLLCIARPWVWPSTTPMDVFEPIAALSRCRISTRSTNLAIELFAV